MSTDDNTSIINLARTMLRDTTTWRKLRHKLTLMTSARDNSTFTGFLRLPTQFAALVEAAAPSVEGGRDPQAPLTITVMGCANGSEAFTISSVLMSRRPDLPVRVRGYDINADVIRKAKSARYAHDEIYNNKAISEEFVHSTFDREADAFVVKRAIAERVTFETGNVLDRSFAETLAGSDIVFAQNFLFHLDPKMARVALENLLVMGRSGGLLFIDGTDLGLRLRFVRRHGLCPVEFEMERIHNEARWARAVGWPYSYWGLEPFLTYRRDWQRRYATIFLVP